jgi:membrane-bound ClpP family serine protease
MTFDFADASPVKRASSGGRKADPNPFATVIGEIALKTNDNGPIARSFVVKHDARDAENSDAKTVINRIRRQLSDAGRANTPACSVNVDDTPKKVGAKGKETDSTTETVITFWTVPPIIRKKRQPKTDGAIATATV